MNRYKLLKITSFISSMFPFIIYLTLKYWNSTEGFDICNYVTPKRIVILILGLCILSILYIIIFYNFFIKNNDNVNYKRIKLSKGISKEKTNTSDYLLANVLPVVTLEMDEVYKIIFIIIIVILLGIMYIKNNLYYINPLYDLIDVKIYSGEVTIVDNNNVEQKDINKMIISKINLYTFKNKYYKAIEGIDTIIITEEE